jgi:hypothetical protein
MSQQERNNIIWKACDVVHGPLNLDKYNYEGVSKFLCSLKPDSRHEHQQPLCNPKSILRNWQLTAAPHLSTTNNLTVLKYIKP